MNNILASLFGGATGGGSNPKSNGIFIVILVVFFVLMIGMTIIPNRKQKKRYENMMKSISVGDKIMTTSGFIGTVIEINTDSDRFTVDIGTEDNPVQIIIVRGAIKNKM